MNSHSPLILSNDNNADPKLSQETFDCYQVVRGAFFAHSHEPTFTFSRNQVYLNMACLRQLPQAEYVQILVHPEEKKLAVRPCRQEEKDSFRWCTQNAQRRYPRKIPCPIFFAKICSLMGWNPTFRYKLLGKLIHSKDDVLFLFDLRTPEIFPRNFISNESSPSSRLPNYPESWKDQFGISMEEHGGSLQVNMFDGYTVFELADQPPSIPDGIGKNDVCDA